MDNLQQLSQLVNLISYLAVLILVLYIIEFIRAVRWIPSIILSFRKLFPRKIENELIETLDEPEVEFKEVNYDKEVLFPDITLGEDEEILEARSPEGLRIKKVVEQGYKEELEDDGNEFYSGEE